ncbi:MAG TPA: threonine aldolase family protein [Ramlibacter sp.]|nr:threonine aldolase family protein [Ramlibacter sp.]
MIDLYSDTKTRPTPAMRLAIAQAEVGDEQHGEDPTVTRLTDRAAALLGKQAAVFLPSGTMANEIAVAVHCRPGDEVLAHEHSHLLNFEAGGAAGLAGAMVRPLAGDRGMFKPEVLKAALRPRARHLPRSRLVSVEQTTNLGGGAVWALPLLDEVTGVARDAGLATHLDGARLMNAVLASDVAADRFAAGFDTVFLDFTKGLGAPFGAVLAGSAATIEEAWRWKQRLGGSMRQAGLMAAACLHALDHHVGRLAEDHANARRLAQALAEIRGLRVEPVHTNMVFCDVSALGLSATAFNDRLREHGIRMSTQGPSRLRAVTHLDVSAADIETVARAAAAVAAA